MHRKKRMVNKSRFMHAHAHNYECGLACVVKPTLTSFQCPSDSFRAANSASRSRFAFGRLPWTLQSYVKHLRQNRLRYESTIFSYSTATGASEFILLRLEPHGCAFPLIPSLPLLGRSLTSSGFFPFFRDGEIGESLDEWDFSDFSPLPPSPAKHRA